MASLTSRATTLTIDTDHARVVSTAVLVLTAVSLAKAAILLAGFLVIGYTLEARFSPWFKALEVVAYGTTATMLVVVARRDRRAVTLAGLLAVVAATFGDSLNDRSNPLLDFLDRRVRADAFLPFMLWSFASLFPMPASGTRFAWGCRIGIVASGLLGIVLAAVALSPQSMDQLSPVQPLVRQSDEGLYWPILIVLSVPAVLMLWARAADAPAAERRRFTLLAASVAFALLPIAALVLATAASSAVRDFANDTTGRLLAGAVAYLGLLVAPWGTAHAVLVDRALDVRFVMRGAVRYLWGQHAARLLVAGPLVALAVLLYAQRHVSVADLLIGPPAPAFAALLVMTGLAIIYRRDAADALERRFLRDRHHARTVMAALPHLVNRASSVHELATRIDEELRRALRIRGAAVAWVTAAGTLDDALGRGGVWHGVVHLAPLARPFVGLTKAVGRHDRDWRTMAGRLPYEGQAFFEAADIEAVVPLISGPAATGLLLLEARPDGVPLGAEDLDLLDTVATSAAARLELLRTAATPGQITAMTGECAACGLVVDADICPCGGAVHRNAVPRDLRGKVFFRRRIGAGAYGAVYLARDVDLNQDRAVKAIRLVPGKVAFETVRHEATLMAAVRHPNLLVIHALESHGDLAFLVSELMERGTLAHRLRHGALPAEAVSELGLQLASALAHLHRAHVLHRDIKPSNIGFTADDTPKLMDFGLAVESAAAARHEWRFVGTPAYVSPEVADGEPWTPADDVWSLAMVLLESIAGAHPLKGVEPAEALAILRRERGALGFLPSEDRRPPATRALVAVLRDRRRSVHSLMQALGHSGSFVNPRVTKEHTHGASVEGS